MGDKLKLSGRPEKAVTWIWLEAGTLKIEFYDFSETAQRMFGNDIAYLLTIYEMNELYSRANQEETSLIRWMTDNFKSYFDVKQWLEENEIGFHKEIGSLGISVIDTPKSGPLHGNVWRTKK